VLTLADPVYSGMLLKLQYAVCRVLSPKGPLQHKMHDVQCDWLMLSKVIH
jgi:hypothetical protein